MPHGHDDDLILGSNVFPDPRTRLLGPGICGSSQNEDPRCFYITVCIQFNSIRFLHHLPALFVEPPRRSSAVRSKLTGAVISQYSALPHSPLTAALTMGTHKKVQSSGRAE